MSFFFLRIGSGGCSYHARVRQVAGTDTGCTDSSCFHWSSWFSMWIHVEVIARHFRGQIPIPKNCSLELPMFAFCIILADSSPKTCVRVVAIHTSGTVNCQWPDKETLKAFLPYLQELKASWSICRAYSADEWLIPSKLFLPFPPTFLTCRSWNLLISIDRIWLLDQIQAD